MNKKLFEMELGQRIESEEEAELTSCLELTTERDIEDQY